LTLSENSAQTDKLSIVEFPDSVYRTKIEIEQWDQVANHN